MPHHARKSAWLALPAAVALGLAGCHDPHAPTQPSPRAAMMKIDHVILIYQENWSFDGLYGRFPNANGIANAGDAAKQLDPAGRPLTEMTIPNDPAFPPGLKLPVAPFDLKQFITPDQRTRDLVHRFQEEQLQIDGGKMDKFVAFSDAGGLVMSYFDATNLPEGKLAQEYTLCDNCFHSAFGGSFLNHVLLVAAAAPVWPDAPRDLVMQLDDQGSPKNRKGSVTADGYAINTVYPVNGPHPAKITDPKRLLPAQTMPTIGDRLTAANISWAWYSGGWDDTEAGRPDPEFEFNHQPFAYFENYRPGTPARAEHLKDERDFFAALKSGNLPAVSLIKPLGPNDEHPNYAGLLQGQLHVEELVHAVQASAFWKNSLIVITYDENGGRWDHVAPPQIDRWGPGTRVPMVVISPFAKRHFVDHTQYETVSLLKFIEERWNLAPLGTRDANANDLTNALQSD